VRRAALQEAGLCLDPIGEPRVAHPVAVEFAPAQTLMRRAAGRPLTPPIIPL
jgi:hypothetical protein